MILEKKDLKDRTYTIGKKPYWDAIEKTIHQTVIVDKQVRTQLRTTQSMLRLIEIEIQMSYAIF